MQEKLKIAEEHLGEYMQARRVELGMQRRDIVHKLREARRADNRELVLNGWRQSMSGPGFEVSCRASGSRGWSGGELFRDTGYLRINGCFQGQ